MTTPIEAAAAELIAARRIGRLADLSPAHVPASEAEAYAIQDLLIRNAGSVIGWKVSPAAPGKPSRCAPILPEARIADGGTLPPRANAPELEGEIAFVLGKDLPEGTEGFTEDRVRAAVAGVCLAIEVLDSRFFDRKAVGAFTAIADLQSNDGLVTGPVRADWQGLDFAQLRPVFTLPDGTDIAPSKPMPGTAEVVAALIWLAAHSAARGQPLRAGQIVITGARPGPFPFPPETTAELTCPGLAPVRVARGAASPKT